LPSGLAVTPCGTATLTGWPELVAALAAAAERVSRAPAVPTATTALIRRCLAQMAGFKEQSSRFGQTALATL
jgi:hypothetical protein